MVVFVRLEIFPTGDAVMADWKKDYPALCACGKSPTSWTTFGDQKVSYCDECDPDPDVDLSDSCYKCGSPSCRSSYVGGGIYLGVCAKHDKGQMLGLEHIAEGCELPAEPEIDL